MITHPKLAIKLDTIPRSFSEQIRKWRNDAKIYSWCRQSDLLTETKHETWMACHPNDSKIRMYLIKDQGDFPVGVCGLTDIDLINQRAEFSLYIESGSQGFGHGKEALKLLCYHGFNSLPLNTIWGESFQGNPAMMTFEEVGFVKDGVRRDFYFKNGSHLDAVLYSIKKGELKI